MNILMQVNSVAELIKSIQANQASSGYSVGQTLSHDSKYHAFSSERHQDAMVGSLSKTLQPSAQDSASLVLKSSASVIIFSVKYYSTLL